MILWPDNSVSKGHIGLKIPKCLQRDFGLPRGYSGWQKEAVGELFTEVRLDFDLINFIGNFFRFFFLKFERIIYLCSWFGSNSRSPNFIYDSDR